MSGFVDVFAALADPTRLRIILLVRDIELAMGELADVLDQSQPRVSRHVRILAEAGLIERHKEGAWVFVRLARNGPTKELFALLDSRPGTDELIAGERIRLKRVRMERQKAVNDWFEANAAEWDFFERLGGPETVIDTDIAEAAAKPQVGRLLDIGTGTGRMLELLAPKAKSAVGIDRSPEMLRVARGKLGPAADCEVRQADMALLPFDDESFDTITLHQVLHFAEDPASVLSGTARVLAPGGKVLIADYAAHDLEELRSLYRHVRLGFENETMHGWLKGAGLKPALLASHAGPELTVNLWEGRR